MSAPISYLNRWIYVLLLLVFGQSLCAQKDSSSIKFIPLPVVYSSPEVGLAFGGFGVLSYKANTQDTLTPASQVQFGAVYTTENQLLLYLPFELYSNKRVWTLRGELGYYIYSYKFFGIGEETVVGGETYEVTFPRVQVDGLRKIRPHLYGGFQYAMDNLNMTFLDPEGMLIDGVLGAEGGTISGFGPIIEHDSRDNVYASKRGCFASIRGGFYDRILLSDYTYRTVSVDLRYFKTYGKTTLGAQGIFEANSNGTPFTQLGLIGGQKTMRGYFRGRYRDLHLILSQLELRRQIKGRFGLALFGSVADTYAEQADFEGLRWAGGAGVRFALIPERRINLRVDYAIGEGENSGLYFTIGEAF